MLKSDYKNSQDSSFVTKNDLDNLLRRLRKGMKLSGRIIECLENNRYLLRIWGYNILTYSEQLFQKFDEIQLTVIEIEPHLVLDFMNENCLSTKIVNKEAAETDIFV
ncbi:MAG: hypothetical protein J7L86_07205 [Candidatus Marinimicrobia bacterium]|nr:hypothetical protein [Candidatus Neomarinimicrobiota bacterium]